MGGKQKEFLLDKPSRESYLEVFHMNKRVLYFLKDKINATSEEEKQDVARHEHLPNWGIEIVPVIVSA